MVTSTKSQAPKGERCGNWLHTQCPGGGCKQLGENPINILGKRVQWCKETCGESLLAASPGLSLEGLFY